VTNRVRVLTFLVVLGLAGLAQAQTFTTLYNFTGNSDGGQPYAGVIQDQAGNLYGTTNYGGDLNCNAPYGCGVVYEVSTVSTETVLHSFSGLDGGLPVAPVVRDKAGNLYGTTAYGGHTNYGYGAVFKIDTAGNETVLYSFTGSSDGCEPEQGLVVGKSGTVFGTTYQCGSSGYGTIFRVGSAGNFTLLHTFAGGSSDGKRPSFGHLTMDKSGNLYGLAYWGGANNSGVLYKLSKSGTFTVLHSFAGGTSDGCNPYGSVVQDNAGNLYGTTVYCGSKNYGTLWKVNKKGKETILHNFSWDLSDGCLPCAGVTRDSKGNLYGVTYGCGANTYGALYKLSMKGRLTLLHSFDLSDGVNPYGEVLRTANGTLFGTAQMGGTYNAGTVWSYVP